MGLTMNGVGRQDWQQARPCSYQDYRLQKRPVSLAELAGYAAFFFAVILFFLAPKTAWLPLALFLLACFLTPFYPGCPFFFPVISRGEKKSGQIVLTFDDGPDQHSTVPLLQLLQQHRVPATFFVNGKRVRKYPVLATEIAAQGHEIGNHTYTHDPCIMFRKSERLVREIELTQRILARHGIFPVFFRPPVGVNTPAYGEALFRTGLIAVNFSCRIRDMGNRRITGLAARVLRQVGSGDIVLLHDVAPAGGDKALREWLEQIDLLLIGLAKRRLQVVSLSEFAADSVKKRS